MPHLIHLRHQVEAGGGAGHGPAGDLRPHGESPRQVSVRSVPGQHQLSARSAPFASNARTSGCEMWTRAAEAHIGRGNGNGNGNGNGKDSDGEAFPLILQAILDGSKFYGIVYFVA
eukprot:806244-Pyramimonas_sp.AAC.1